MSVVRRRTETVVPASKPEDCANDEMLVSFPALMEFITTVAYDDGKLRQSPTLTVFYDAPYVKVCLNDRDQGLTAWVAAAGLWGALSALNTGLATDGLEWRRPSTGPKKGRK